MVHKAAKSRRGPRRRSRRSVSRTKRPGRLHAFAGPGATHGPLPTCTPVHGRLPSATPRRAAAASSAACVTRSPLGTCTAKHEKLGLSAVDRAKLARRRPHHLFRHARAPQRRRHAELGERLEAGAIRGIVGGVRAVGQDLVAVERHALEDGREDERLAAVAAVGAVRADLVMREHVGVGQREVRAQLPWPDGARRRSRTPAGTPCARRRPSRRSRRAAQPPAGTTSRTRPRTPPPTAGCAQRSPQAPRRRPLCPGPVVVIPAALLNSAAAQASWPTMPMCCGHTPSHAPQPMHEDAGPCDAFQS